MHFVQSLYIINVLVNFFVLLRFFDAVITNNMLYIVF